MHPSTHTPPSACVDASGRQIVIGFNTGRVACAQFLTGRLVGQLDAHRGEVTDLVGAWTDNSGWVSLCLTAVSTMDLMTLFLGMFYE